MGRAQHWRSWSRLWALTAALGIGLIFLVPSRSPAQAQVPPLTSPALEPLPVEEQQLFAAMQPDPPPLAAESHYVTSNEGAHQIYRALLMQKPGGVFVGVGTDQNYLMAGWKKPELLFIMDFDQMIIDLHAVYQIIFLHAKSPQLFVNAWSADAQQQVKTWIVQDLAVPSPEAPSPDLKHCASACQRALQAYNFSQLRVYRRLRFMAQRHRAEGVASFLTDAAQYQYLVELFRTRRVYFFRGDFALHGLGELAVALQKTHRVLDVLYVSNAEKYFPYVSNRKQVSFFKEEMARVPTDQECIVLHTWTIHYLQTFQYAYFVQMTSSFLTELERPEVTTFASMAARHIRWASEVFASQSLSLRKTLIDLDEPPRVPGSVK